jgi:hypothetical protein
MIVFPVAFRRRLGTKVRASKLNIMTCMNPSNLSCGWLKIRMKRDKVQMNIARFVPGVTSRKGVRNRDS